VPCCACAGVGVQLQYLVYETEQGVEFATPEQKAVKRSAAGGAAPSADVSEATAQLIHRMRRMHDEKFGRARPIPVRGGPLSVWDANGESGGQRGGGVGDAFVRGAQGEREPRRAAVT